MAETVVYFSREAVALFRRGQVFNLSGMFSQALVGGGKFGSGISLTRGHACKDDNEHYARAVHESDNNGIDPSAAYEQRHNQSHVDECADGNHQMQTQ